MQDYQFEQVPVCGWRSSQASQANFGRCSAFVVVFIVLVAFFTAALLVDLASAYPVP